MGVQRREQAKPPIPEPDNPAKVLIPISRAAEVYPKYHPVNTPSSQKTPKNPSRQPTIKMFIFQANKRRTESCKKKGPTEEDRP